MDLETHGKSIVMLVRELTDSASITRIYDYCTVFNHNSHTLSGYLGLAEGDGWAFHDTWGRLRTHTAHGHSVKDLILFAYHLKAAELGAVALYAREFVTRRDTRWRYAPSGAQLRPFVRAGVPTEYVSAILYRGMAAPSRQDSFGGIQDRKSNSYLVKERLATEKKTIIELWKSGIDLEYTEELLAA